MQRPAASGIAGGLGDKAKASGSAPLQDRAARHAEEERLKREFIEKKGVARVVGEVKTICTNEQAVEALEAMGVKVRMKGVYTTLHGRTIPTAQLVQHANALLRERNMVRVKPGEKVGA